MKTDAHAFAKKMAEITKGIIESGRAAIPLCCAKRKDGETMFLGFEFNGIQSKDGAALAMRILAQEPGIDYVVFLSDAWVARLSKEEHEKADYSQGVKNMPNRKECIVVSLFGHNRPCEVGQWRYERVAGKPVFEPKLEWMKQGIAEGRFVPEGSLQ